MFVSKKDFSDFTKLAENRIDRLTAELAEAAKRIEYLESVLGAKAKYEYGPHYYRAVKPFEGIPVLSQLAALPYTFEVTPPQKEKVIARKVK